MVGSKIRKGAAALLLACAVTSATPADSLHHTLPDSLRWVTPGDVALALFGYALLPLWVGIGAASLLSPTLSLEHTADWQSGWALGTGIGWSGSSDPWRFSRARLQLEYEQLGTARWNATALADWNALTLFGSPLFRAGASVGVGGQWRPGARWQPYAQGELWLRNAMGIWYIGLFPQHSLGLRLRFFPARPGQPRRWAVAIGYWSTVTW